MRATSNSPRSGGIGDRAIATRGQRPFQLDVGDVAHVRPSPSQPRHLAGVDVVGRDVVADLDGSQCELQPDVPLADDQDPHRFGRTSRDPAIDSR